VIARIALEFRRRVRLPGRLASLFYGFVFWLVFLLVLEPDNALRASQQGHALLFGLEAARIVAAALLGAVATPLLLLLTNRFPVVGAHRWRHVVIHLIGNACLAFVLILASCFLAAWGFYRQLAPSLAEVGSQLTSNWTLLVFALCAFTAIVHMVRFVRHTHDEQAAVPEVANVAVADADAERVARIPIKTGGRLRFVDQASIDWIQTQGNYVAMHAGANVQLLRKTLTDFEAELEASRFVRIHRRMIVAIDRIHEMKPLPNGDATLRLKDGQELRVSRRYREEVVRRWGGG
jgi:membrane protein implicated in regulation of membrane protease activity